MFWVDTDSQSGWQWHVWWILISGVGGSICSGLIPISEVGGGSICSGWILIPKVGGSICWVDTDSQSRGQYMLGVY